MSRDPSPLKIWMLSNGYGNPDTGVVSEGDCAELAEQLPDISAEGIRQVANGYRPPGWDLAFALEVFTVGALCAHDLKDERWYAKGAA